MARSPTTKPQRRGMVTAFAFACLLVFGGVLLIRYNRGIGSALGLTPAKESTAAPSKDNAGSVFSGIFGRSRESHAVSAPSHELSALDQQMQSMADDGATVGYARIMQNNMVEVRGKNFVLWGVVIPTYNFTCVTGTRAWRCGGRATRVLQKITGGHLVACFTKGHDLNGNPYGRCRVGNRGLASELVRQGWAVEDPNITLDFRFDQAHAQIYKLGLWGTNINPTDLLNR